MILCDHDSAYEGDCYQSLLVYESNFPIHITQHILYSLLSPDRKKGAGGQITWGKMLLF